MKRLSPTASCVLMAAALMALALHDRAHAVAADASPSVKVAIDNFNFNPKDLTISAGTSVTWVNHDDVPHTATSKSVPAAFDSKALDTDESYSFRFTEPGVYRYYCKVHTHMTGTITVK